MLPIAEAIANQVAPGGSLVLSGLLEVDMPAVLERFSALGLEREAERSVSDASGDRWVSPRLRPR